MGGWVGGDCTFLLWDGGEGKGFGKRLLVGSFLLLHESVFDVVGEVLIAVLSRHEAVVGGWVGGWVGKRGFE